MHLDFLARCKDVSSERLAYETFPVVRSSMKQHENFPSLIPKCLSSQHSLWPYSFSQLLMMGSLRWSPAHQGQHEESYSCSSAEKLREQLFELTVIQPWGDLVLEVCECTNRQMCVFGNICISCSPAVTLVFLKVMGSTSHSTERG